ncbi:hypothetical protein [Psychromonas algicola]|uniref:hypothetical protein n=1 Tax=Psychromonas algicola TaxID=2555642 RepID=UPI00106813DD|nr:hypothetical protein [Psychromonas sp. RZ5]TEW50229.1 hypothetical protein E2R67_09460 [Psychromonas sp. RZ5]
MNVILVSDIFGKTPALIKLAEAIGATAIVDPYDGVNMEFEDESKAYAYFVEHVGFEQYFDILQGELQNQASPIDDMNILIGFSIGASAIWKLSDNPAITNVHSGICYYGSQIRNLTTVTPHFDIDLIFPEKEDHFDVLALQAELSQKKNVKITQTNYLHGFMNSHSDNYNQVAYLEHAKRLCIKNNYERV